MLQVCHLDYPPVIQNVLLLSSLSEMFKHFTDLIPRLCNFTGNVIYSLSLLQVINIIYAPERLSNMPYTTVILLVSIYGNRVLLFPSFQMNNLLLNAHILDFDVLIITTITITIFSTNVGKDISTNR